MMGDLTALELLVALSVGCLCGVMGGLTLVLLLSAAMDKDDWASWLRGAGVTFAVTILFCLGGYALLTAL